MTNHVRTTLDGALDAPGGAMRWAPPRNLLDWRRALATVGELLRQVADGVRAFLDAVADLWTWWAKVIVPTIRTVAAVAARRQARLSAMRREYHRRQR